MLMEHSTKTSHGNENAKNSRLLDLQKLYNSKPWISSGKKRGYQNSVSASSRALKRKLGGYEAIPKCIVKKSKKEVLLSSFSSGEKIKKSAGSAKKGQLSYASSTKLGKSESRVDQKVGGVGGLGSISLKLNSNVNIPKRPRDLVGRKKVEADLELKQDGTSSSKVSSDEDSGKLNGDPSESLLQNGGSEGVSDGGFIARRKQKKIIPNDYIQSRSSGSDSCWKLKTEDSYSSIHNGHVSTMKARGTLKKSKEMRTGGACADALGEIKPAKDNSSRICDGSQDEGNLEANAARMLSSRFDTICTGDSLGGKLPSIDGLSALISFTGNVAASRPNSRTDSDVVSSDAEVRILRPRDQPEGKELLRQRRYFYEVLSREMDSYWVLNRRIKVFWRLDQSWYVGHVIAYDAVRKLHHIKYDDRDEEWVDLQNERFKLLLLPSEVPRKVGNRKSIMLNNQARKLKHIKITDSEINSNNYMESEPIISWLVRSACKKTPSYETRKKQRTLSGSARSQSSSFSDDPLRSLEVGSSGRKADDLVLSTAMPENVAINLQSKKPLAENVSSHNFQPPIVYFRRRFHRKEQQDGDIHATDLCQVSEKPTQCRDGLDFVDPFVLDTDVLQSMFEYAHVTSRLSPDEFIWDTDDSGVLKLTVPVTNLKVFIMKFHLPLPVVTDNLFGLLFPVHLLQHGSLISLWPMVHLEMLFVDNSVGLRFSLYEGCLKKALFLVLLVLGAFDQPNQKELHVDLQLPATSIRFRFTGLQDLQKQLVFTFYNFSEISNSRWSYLDRKLKHHCMLSKQLPPSECTYDNIKALRNGSKRLPVTCVSQKSSLLLNLRKRSRKQKTCIKSRQCNCVRSSQLPSDSDEEPQKLPSFSLSFVAAPTFYQSLHLKLLMEHSIPSSNSGELDPVSLTDHSHNSDLVSADKFATEDHPLSAGRNLELVLSGKFELESCSIADGDQALPENGASVQLPENCKGHLPPAGPKWECSPSTSLTVEIPSLDPIEGDIESSGINSPGLVELASDIYNGAMESPNSTAHSSTCHRSRVRGSSSSTLVNLSPTWPDGKQYILHNGFGNGSKKPRTQVSYSLPFVEHDCNSKYKLHHAKGFPHRRIRRAIEKKASEALTALELLSCEANLLVTVGDRGWRECRAKVVLELADHSEWRLTVKICGNTKYSYKAHQFLQPGTTNRYTHAVMWKGGNDWILEFPDRSQWATFKEMHEECYNRNCRAASVKNVPIPGVRLVEETDDNTPEVPFVRSTPTYYQQLETDVDIAMDPQRALYDMDSDDEQWIAKHKSTDSNECGRGDISEEIFEKTMDVFEKIAYAKQRDHLSSDELEELTDFGSLEVIKIIYEHWLEKRSEKGMPLIRHLQAPLWEKYQEQLKEWEKAMVSSNGAISSGWQEKPMAIEKPPMFAFCLKPRGLEVTNRGSKQRSHKKLPVGAVGNTLSRDPDAFHLVGQRLNGHAFGDERVSFATYNQQKYHSSPVLQGSARVFSPRDAGYYSLIDGSEKHYYPKLYRNNSKLCFLSPSCDQQAFPSYNQRTMNKRIALHAWNGSNSELYSPTAYQADGFRRPSFEKLYPYELDEFRMRDAASAARHDVAIAKMKRENAQRMLCRADLAMHKAVAAIMTAEAVNASYKEPNSNV